MYISQSSHAFTASRNRSMLASRRSSAFSTRAARTRMASTLRVAYAVSKPPATAAAAAIRAAFNACSFLAVAGATVSWPVRNLYQDADQRHRIRADTWEAGGQGGRRAGAAAT